MATKFSYDSHCEDLARTFLEDSPSLKAHVDQHAPELAQRIQDAIDDYLSDQESKLEHAVPQS